MVAKTTIHSLLRVFAQRQNSAYVHYAEFCEYMKRYAQHHIEEQPDFNPFLSNPDAAMQKDLAKLQDERKILVVNQDTDKKAIIVTSYFTEKFAARYREIINNPAIPYPLLTDLPKSVPHDIIDRKQAGTFLVELFENLREQSQKKESEPSPTTKNDDLVLYGLILPRDMPEILLPASISVTTLLDIALSKLRQMLRKDEFHDYFLKKLKISNPGKELSVKNFFTQFIQKPNESMESIKTSGEAFYFWSQLCYFIRQDYEKVKDYTQEDIAILQSVFITEISIGYYKNKAQQDLQRNTALRQLEQILNKPPYYFTKEAINRFVDSRGIPLLGQYSDEDLTEFLHTASTALSNNNLPELLIFKLETSQRYYIYKNKVIPLIIRLCSDARDIVKENLTKEWYSIYRQFDSISAMTDQKAFEIRLEGEVRTTAPILYALLNSNFLSLVHYENRANQESNSGEKFNLFANGQLLPYSELLMISRQEIVTDSKILLPFWYTVPLISWIAKFIFKPQKSQKGKVAKPRIQEEKTQVTIQTEESSSNSENNNRKLEFRRAARELEKKVVPPGSTLDRELSAYAHQWNRILDKETSANLTEDVNSLIRDYMRKTLRTLKSNHFTMERIQILADTLVKTPSLQKIREKEQLQMYVQLYIIKLVRNL